MICNTCAKKRIECLTRELKECQDKEKAKKKEEEESKGEYDF